MRKFMLLAIAMAMTTAMVGTAAANSGRIDWDGQRGLDSIGACAADQDGYLHWVLTPGGKQKLSVDGTELTVNGNAVQGERNGEGGGAIHFYTAFYDPAEITEAFATFSGTAGKNALLTISSGCEPQGGVITPCNNATASGGAGVTETVHELGQASGTFQFDYTAYNVPDRFEVIYEGTKLLDETIGTAVGFYSHEFNAGGLFHGSTADPVSTKTTSLTYSGTSTQVTVRVSGPGGTVWDYMVHCPA